MKKVIYISLIMAGLVSACNNKKQEEEKKQQLTGKEQSKTVLNTPWTQEIQLNKGAKWEANQETTAGVEKMKVLLKSESTTSIEDHHQLANKLDTVKINLVKACTMQGPSHDNLHIWLIPLIKKIKALSATEKVAEATEIKQNIADHLEAYSKYFY